MILYFIVHRSSRPMYLVQTVETQLSIVVVMSKQAYPLLIPLNVAAFFWPLQDYLEIYKMQIYYMSLLAVLCDKMQMKGSKQLHAPQSSISKTPSPSGPARNQPEPMVLLFHPLPLRYPRHLRRGYTIYSNRRFGKSLLHSRCNTTL